MDRWALWVTAMGPQKLDTTVLLSTHSVLEVTLLPIFNPSLLSSSTIILTSNTLDQLSYYLNFMWIQSFSMNFFVSGLILLDIMLIKLFYAWESSCTIGGNINGVACWRTIWRFLLKTENRVTCDPAAPFPGHGFRKRPEQKLKKNNMHPNVHGSAI